MWYDGNILMLLKQLVKHKKKNKPEENVQPSESCYFADDSLSAEETSISVDDVESPGMKRPQQERKGKIYWEAEENPLKKDKQKPWKCGKGKEKPLMSIKKEKLETADRKERRKVYPKRLPNPRTSTPCVNSSDSDDFTVMERGQKPTKKKLGTRSVDPSQRTVTVLKHVPLNPQQGSDADVSSTERVQFVTVMLQMKDIFPPNYLGFYRYVR